MNEGIRTVVYPVGDLARARTLYSRLLGADPSMDEPYYVDSGSGTRTSVWTPIVTGRE